VKLVYFAHSFRSCWNNGNAHFLRGILREFASRGWDAVGCEAETPWSLANLTQDHGDSGLSSSLHHYRDLKLRTYRSPQEATVACADADLVLVHEWNEPGLVAAIGALRARGARFTLMFHDTHHRAISEPQAIGRFDLSGYDGVLAFGSQLTDVYAKRGWGRRAFVWHEAADTKLFHPPQVEHQRSGIVWIGNGGDGERNEELESMLLKPAHDAGLALDIYGVRYTPDMLERLGKYGALYRGWLPNALAPEIFARHLATVHVPRRFYAQQLGGIPTIRVFEALACGIPLVCAPWDDSENLFRPGKDYLIASDGVEMTAQLRALRDDRSLREELVRNGWQTIRQRHTCAHRVDELLQLVDTLEGKSRQPANDLLLERAS
jgi:spore maturation protein CgeB